MSTPSEDAPRTVSRLFDLRMIIAILFWIYGVVLTIMGFSTVQEDLDRAGGLNLNLWGGIFMLLTAAFFTLWVMLRPLKVPEPSAMEEDGRPTGH